MPELSRRTLLTGVAMTGAASGLRANAAAKNGNAAPAAIQRLALVGDQPP